MAKSFNQRDKIYKTIPKKLYLEQILLRLEKEYIQILNMVTEYNLKNVRGIGFWSLIRIIFPVIETVSSVMGKQKEDFLEEELKVPCGHLVWELYRHALMHTDELWYAEYEGKIISWGAHLGNEGLNHFVDDKTDSHSTTIHIVIPSLYFNLREFLVKEIAKNDTSEIQIQVGIHFPNHQTKVIKELEDLTKNH